MNPPSPTPSEAPVRPGLHPRWQSDAALLKKAQKDPSVPLIAAKLAEGHAALRVYAAGDNPFKDPLDPQQSRQGSLCGFVRESLDHPYAYAGPPGDFAACLPTMAASLWRSYWRWQIEWQLQCLPQAKGPVWLREAAYLLGKCLYAGWMTEARVLAGAIRQMYAERKLTNTEGKESQPLSHFLLRIAFDHFELPFAHWGRGRHPKLDARNPYKQGQCLGEPVLNELFEHWRDPDLSPWTEHLLWLCDYATHRVKSTMDYEHYAYSARFPGVVLPWMRLREAQGLRAPLIDHPLLAAPYDRLPAPLPKPEDPVLDAVLERLTREELPQLLAMGRGDRVAEAAG